MGIFPSATSALRLIGAVLEEQGDEWLAVRRYVSLRSMALPNGSRPEEPGAPTRGAPKEVVAA